VEDTLGRGIDPVIVIKTTGIGKSCPAIFEVPLYLITDRISDYCAKT
jgi:hypothetical protein